jgi:hypothetical protein
MTVVKAFRTASFAPLDGNRRISCHGNHHAVAHFSLCSPGGSLNDAMDGVGEGLAGAKAPLATARTTLSPQCHDEDEAISLVIF